MKRVAALALLLMSAATFAATTAPRKVSVRELLTHADKYDKQRVDVTGYYTAGMEDSQLWPSARAAKQSRSLDASIYIDPRIWDPQLRPHRPKDLLDPDYLRDRSVRVIGTFFSRGVLPSVVSTAPDGPSITDVSYFRPVR
ncbi:MAG TPA: hypothetical protein VGM65_10265 [Candidatus Udaeobacter sp.]|jgi:hypothetical protein